MSGNSGDSKRFSTRPSGRNQAGDLYFKQVNLSPSQIEGIAVARPRKLSFTSTCFPPDSTIWVPASVEQLWVIRPRCENRVAFVDGGSIYSLTILSCKLGGFGINITRLSCAATIRNLTLVDCVVDDNTRSWLLEFSLLDRLQFGNNRNVNDLLQQWDISTLTVVDLAGSPANQHLFGFLNRQKQLNHFVVDLDDAMWVDEVERLVRSKPLASAVLRCSSECMHHYVHLTQLKTPNIIVQNQQSPSESTGEDGP